MQNATGSNNTAATLAYNISFVSYGNHNAALAAIQKKFPTAIFNSTPLCGKQTITVVRPPSGTTKAHVRNCVRGFRGHMVP